MDLFKSFAGSSDNEKPGSETSKSELLASAKLVAEAAQSTFNKESDKVDKAKVAGAAADLLDAGENYAKFDKQGAGKYVDQAEEYLRKYESSNSTTHAPAADQAEKPAPPADTPAAEPPADTPAAEPPAKKEEESGSGYGDVLKLAGGFFK